MVLLTGAEAGSIDMWPNSCQRARWTIAEMGSAWQRLESNIGYTTWLEDTNQKRWCFQ